MRTPKKCISIKDPEHQKMCFDIQTLCDRIKHNHGVSVSFSHALLMAAHGGWDKVKEELNELSNKLPG